MKKPLPTTYRIEYYGCTGYGDVGRTANLYAPDGSCFGGDSGADDYEAVLTSLTAEGWSFDEAFDAVGDVIRGATRIDYIHCEPRR